MAFNAVRLSPSGPVIENEDGGTMQPGPGFQLRLDEGSTTIVSATLTASADSEMKQDPSDANPPFLRPQLDNPDQNRRYRITGAFDLTNSGVGSATCAVSLEMSFDGGTNWTQVALNEQVIPSDAVKHCRIDQTLTLGSVLGMPAQLDDVRCRLLVNPGAATNVSFVSGPSSGGDGSAFLQLVEAL